MWGLLLVAVLGTFWFLSRQILLLVASLVVAALVVAAVCLELNVVTDKEYVVDAVYQMAEAVRTNDPDGIVQFVADENQVFANRVRREMGLYDFRSCQINGFSVVELGDEDAVPRLARVGFSVWATGNYRGRIDTLNSAIVAVELEFAKIDGNWKIQAYGYRPGNAPGNINLIRQ